MIFKYLPILLFFIVGILIVVFLIGIGINIRKYSPNIIKNSSYECGFAEFGNTNIPFDVRFYVVSILFIIFDLETAFFFPWAIIFRKLKIYSFYSIIIFLGILAIGFVYEWKKGALDWE